MLGEITNYLVKTNIWQRKVVKYRCPHCEADLESPLKEAGSEQPCPICYRRFKTPGEKELAEASKLRGPTTAIQKLAPADDPQQRKPAEPLPKQHVHVRSVPAPPPPPELVWYGRMLCHSCGYQWMSKRNTPPAKCAGCGSRQIALVREPRQRRWFS
jgi:DNA-directed RNA polymerase subunit RPC12/RpoP